MNWFVYIVETVDKHYYTGITTDIEKRFKQHANGKGAKYFNCKIPAKVVYYEEGHTRSSASKREAVIKKLSHTEKNELIKKRLIQTIS